MNSTMLRVKIDRGDPTDLYEQVAGEIRRESQTAKKPSPANASHPRKT